MNKPIIIAEVDNLIYNTAEAVTNFLNDEYNVNYSELEFYGDRFKSVIKQNYESHVVAAIDSVGLAGLAQKRNGSDKLENLLLHNRTISVSLSRAYKKNTTIEDYDMLGIEEPTIYVGTDYNTCVKMPADLRILVKFDVDHKRNYVLGNENNFYIVNTLDEVVKILEFYLEHPELIYYH